MRLVLLLNLLSLSIGVCLGNLLGRWLERRHIRQHFLKDAKIPQPVIDRWFSEL